MEQVYGPGMLGTVVLVDPATGLPYKAEGGGGAAETTVRSATFADFAYIGVAPTAHNNPATDPWYSTRISLQNFSDPVGHATGAWNDRSTLTYA